MVQILSSSAYIMQSMINDHEQIASKYHGFAPRLHKRYNHIFGVACCSRVGLEDFIHFVFNFQPALQFTNEISDTELFFLDNMLRVTDDHISTHYKETDTHTYLHHQSSHPSQCIAKKGLPRSHLLRLRRLCSEDSDFLVKGGEWILSSIFTERSSYHSTNGPG